MIGVRCLFAYLSAEIYTPGILAALVGEGYMGQDNAPDVAVCVLYARHVNVTVVIVVQ